MKKVISSVLMIAMLTAFLALPVQAISQETTESDLRTEGTILLETLLNRQFNSFVTGELIDTSDIFLASESTEFYNQYLYWYTGLTEATKEYWTEYSFSLQFVEIKGDILIFTGDLEYGRTCSLYTSEAHGFPYIIRVAESNGKYYITEIDSDEPNFFGFKTLTSSSIGNYADISATNATPFSRELSSAISTNEVDELIADYVEFKEECAAMVVDPAEVVDMEDNHEAYLLSETSVESVRGTDVIFEYEYDRERGRRYADIYYSSANPCFYQVPDTLGDCTNWVSQCVWAAYGGWTDGDSEATMTANINARKRMQPSTSMNNWFAHKNGVSNPWGNVSNFWNFVTGDPLTGPKAVGYNNNRPWDGNFESRDILTGQVLQVRKSTDTSYKHSVYVTGGTNDSFANIKITQHSPYNRIMLDEFIRSWGTDCYVRMLDFEPANFNN